MTILTNDEEAILNLLKIRKFSPQALEKDHPNQMSATETRVALQSLFMKACVRLDDDLKVEITPIDQGE